MNLKILFLAVFITGLLGFAVLLEVINMMMHAPAPKLF